MPSCCNTRLHSMHAHNLHDLKLRAEDSRVVKYKYWTKCMRVQHSKIENPCVLYLCELACMYVCVYIHVCTCNTYLLCATCTSLIIQTRNSNMHKATKNSEIARQSAVDVCSISIHVYLVGVCVCVCMHRTCNNNKCGREVVKKAPSRRDLVENRSSQLGHKTWITRHESALGIILWHHIMYICVCKIKSEYTRWSSRSCDRIDVHCGYIRRLVLAVVHARVYAYAYVCMHIAHACSRDSCMHVCTWTKLQINAHMSNYHRYNYTSACTLTASSCGTSETAAGRTGWSLQNTLGHLLVCVRTHISVCICTCMTIFSVYSRLILKEYSHASVYTEIRVNDVSCASCDGKNLCMSSVCMSCVCMSCVCRYVWISENVCIHVNLRCGWICGWHFHLCMRFSVGCVCVHVYKHLKNIARVCMSTEPRIHSSAWMETNVNNYHMCAEKPQPWGSTCTLGLVQYGGTCVLPHHQTNNQVLHVTKMARMVI